MDKGYALNMKPVSQWSEGERLAWGLKEDAIRGKEMETVIDSASLQAVQCSVKRRRDAVGASHGQAFQMVIMAQRHKRLASR